MRVDARHEALRLRVERVQLDDDVQVDPAEYRDHGRSLLALAGATMASGRRARCA